MKAFIVEKTEGADVSVWGCFFKEKSAEESIVKHDLHGYKIREIEIDKDVCRVHFGIPS